MAAHYARVQQLQLLLFYKHPKLKELALNSCGVVATRNVLLEHVKELQLEELTKLVTRELRQALLLSMSSCAVLHHHHA